MKSQSRSSFTSRRSSLSSPSAIIISPVHSPTSVVITRPSAPSPINIHGVWSTPSIHRPGGPGTELFPTPRGSAIDQALLTEEIATLRELSKLAYSASTLVGLPSSLRESTHSVGRPESLSRFSNLSQRLQALRRSSSRIRPPTKTSGTLAKHGSSAYVERMKISGAGSGTSTSGIRTRDRLGYHQGTTTKQVLSAERDLRETYRGPAAKPVYGQAGRPGTAVTPGASDGARLVSSAGSLGKSSQKSGDHFKDFYAERKEEEPSVQLGFTQQEPFVSRKASPSMISPGSRGAVTSTREVVEGKRKKVGLLDKRAPDWSSHSTPSPKIETGAVGKTSTWQSGRTGQKPPSGLETSALFQSDAKERGPISRPSAETLKKNVAGIESHDSDSFARPKKAFPSALSSKLETSPKASSEAVRFPHRTHQVSSTNKTKRFATTSLFPRTEDARPESFGALQRSVSNAERLELKKDELSAEFVGTRMTKGISKPSSQRTPDEDRQIISAFDFLTQENNASKGQERKVLEKIALQGATNIVKAEKPSNRVRKIAPISGKQTSDEERRMVSAFDMMFVPGAAASGTAEKRIAPLSAKRTSAEDRQTVSISSASAVQTDFGKQQRKTLEPTVEPVFGKQQDKTTSAVKAGFGKQQSKTSASAVEACFGKQNTTESAVEAVFGKQQSNALEQATETAFGRQHNKTLLPADASVFGKQSKAAKSAVEEVFGKQQSERRKTAAEGVLGKQQNKIIEPTVELFLGRQQSKTLEPTAQTAFGKPQNNTLPPAVDSVFGKQQRKTTDSAVEAVFGKRRSDTTEAALGRQQSETLIPAVESVFARQQSKTTGSATESAFGRKHSGTLEPAAEAVPEEQQSRIVKRASEEVSEKQQSKASGPAAETAFGGQQSKTTEPAFGRQQGKTTEPAVDAGFAKQQSRTTKATVEAVFGKQQGRATDLAMESAFGRKQNRTWEPAVEAVLGEKQTKALEPPAEEAFARQQSKAFGTADESVFSKEQNKTKDAAIESAFGRQQSETLEPPAEAVFGKQQSRRLEPATEAVCGKQRETIKPAVQAGFEKQQSKTTESAVEAILGKQLSKTEPADLARAHTMAKTKTDTYVGGKTYNEEQRQATQAYPGQTVALVETGLSAKESKTIEKASPLGTMLPVEDVRSTEMSSVERFSKSQKGITGELLTAASKQKAKRAKKNVFPRSVSSQRLPGETLQSCLSRQIAQAISSSSVDLESMPLQVNMVVDVVPPKRTGTSPPRAILSPAHVEKTMIIDIKDGHMELELPALYIDAPDGHHLSNNPVNVSINVDVRKESSSSSSMG